MSTTTRSTACDRVRAQIALEVDREVSQFERARRATHVARCAECRAFAADVKAFTEVLRDAPLESLSHPITIRRPRTAVRSLRVPTIAAAMVIALAGISAQLATQFATGGSRSASRGPAVYPTGNELQSEIDTLEVLTERPRLMAATLDLR